MYKLIIAIVLACIPLPVSAQPIYEWITKDGTLAYTDNVDNIPPLYRDYLVVKSSVPLIDYTRFTLVDESAMSRYEWELNIQLDRLREQNLVRTEILSRIPEPVAPTVVIVERRRKLHRREP